MRPTLVVPASGKNKTVLGSLILGLNVNQYKVGSAHLETILTLPATIFDESVYSFPSHLWCKYNFEPVLFLILPSN